MLFNSLTFAIFFIIVLVGYYALPNYRWQNRLIFFASYIFYGWWDVRFLFLIVVSTFTDYVCAQMIGHGRIVQRKTLEGAAFVVFSALAFMGINYKAFHLTLHPVLQFHPGQWATPLGTAVCIITPLWLFFLFLLCARGVHWPEIFRRRFFLAVSIVTNLGILGFFKYFNFFIASGEGFLRFLFGWDVNVGLLHIILPVGISFYTFQTLSYTWDVYRKEIRPTDSFFTYSAYLVFFPQLVAGPIERAKHLLPQFLSARPRPSRQDVQDALWLIFWGLYKKVVVADHMAKVANAVFAPYDQLSPEVFASPEHGPRLLLGVYAFAFQIFGDFSGYTDMARGTAKLLGFDIMLNFNLPYFAASPSDFWRRWHISLSTWLRDYLYIPLGGSRGTPRQTYRNLMATMLLGGLWHGASWTFVIWGAFHGILLSVARFCGWQSDHKKPAPFWLHVGQIILMFHLTCLGWLIFRAQNVPTIVAFLKSIFFHWSNFAGSYDLIGKMVQCGWFLVLFQIVQYVRKDLNPMAKWHWFVRYNVWLFLIMSILTMGIHKSQEFIYFAF